jgi:hypothetical protein
MSLIREFWYVFVFIAIGVLALAFERFRVAQFRIAARKVGSVEGMPADSYVQQRLDELDQEHARRWRWLEVLIVVYHFPVILPTTLLRKDKAVPVWIVYLLTPLLYSALIYALRR